MTTPLVPDSFEVAIDGRPYQVDRSQQGQGAHQRVSTAALRQQADQGSTPGEQSLSREDLWRRSQTDWSSGAGQTYFDRADSDSAQFLSSKGVDPWTKWQLSRLPDVVQARATASSNPNMRLATTFNSLYVLDGGLLYRTPINVGTGSVWTQITPTGGTPNPFSFIASDGNDVYVTDSSTYYWKHTDLSGTTIARSTATTGGAAVSTVAVANGRVMLSGGGVLRTLDASGAFVTVTTSAASPSSGWLGITSGPKFIYAGNVLGNRSRIFKIGILDDGTGLDVATTAVTLPFGEIIRTIKEYLGFMLIGTNLGVRLAAIGADGDLTLGALQRIGGAVNEFETADRFVWFTWTNYDGVSTGLGRLDLSTFTAPLRPAYASDIMATAQGTVASVASTFDGRRVFTVVGSGVYCEGSGRVASATLTTSRISYDISDAKVARFIDLRTQPLAAGESVAVEISNDTSTFTAAGTHDVDGATAPGNLDAQQKRGEELTMRLTLSASGATTGPVVNRTTLRAYPAPPRSFAWTVPVLLYDQVEDLSGQTVVVDQLAERLHIEGLMQTRQLVKYQEGNQVYDVVVDDLVWLPRSLEEGRTDHNGTLLVSLREVSA